MKCSTSGFERILHVTGDFRDTQVVYIQMFFMHVPGVRSDDDIQHLRLPLAHCGAHPHQSGCGGTVGGSCHIPLLPHPCHHCLHRWQELLPQAASHQWCCQEVCCRLQRSVTPVYTCACVYLSLYGLDLARFIVFLAGDTTDIAIPLTADQANALSPGEWHEPLYGVQVHVHSVTNVPDLFMWPDQAAYYMKDGKMSPKQMRDFIKVSSLFRL